MVQDISPCARVDRRFYRSIIVVFTWNDFFIKWANDPCSHDFTDAVALA